MKIFQIPFFIILSLTLHFSIIAILNSLNIALSPLEVSQNKTKPLKVLNIRSVGEKNGKKDYIPILKNSKKSRLKKEKIKTKDLTFNPLKSEAISKFKKSRPGKASLLKNKKRKVNSKLSITNTRIKDFLTTDPYSSPAAEQLAKLDQTDVLFDLVIPKGVPEDELNKHELVFYSFRKRTALAYVNSFQKQLNIFENKNPHLNFPLTSDPETIAGKITYDKNGDILKIETLEFTQITKLQDFFMNVLQDMSSLPNPPKEIINDSKEFVVNFVLEVNGRI